MFEVERTPKVVGGEAANPRGFARVGCGYHVKVPSPDTCYSFADRMPMQVEIR
jgi:hypothetical protein